MIIKTLVIAAAATVAVAGSALAAEAPRTRANPANVRWQDDPTQVWGVSTVMAKNVAVVRTAAAATGTGNGATTEDHDRGRNPGPPEGPPPRGRTPPGRRSPHK